MIPAHLVRGYRVEVKERCQWDALYMNWVTTLPETGLRSPSNVEPKLKMPNYFHIRVFNSERNRLSRINDKGLLLKAANFSDLHKLPFMHEHGDSNMMHHILK